MSQNEIIAIENKVQLINHYDAIAKDASEKSEVIKSEIKDLMSSEGLEQISTPSFVIRFIDVISSRFDTKRFKQEIGEDMYNYYTKQVFSKKFTITQ